MVEVFKRNNVTITGEGEPVLLFAHGFGCDQNSWKYIKNAFTANYKCVFFDYVGAGRSDLSFYDAEKYNSLNGYATDVIEICRALQSHNIIFIGHSVSCMVGVLASIKTPGIFKKMVLIGPSPCYINKEGYTGGFHQETIDSLYEVMEEDYISWAQSLAPSIMGDKNDPALGKELADSFCSIDPVIAKQFARVTFSSDNRKDLPLVETPSLTIQCSVDNIAPLSVGEYVHQHLPNNTLTVLDAHTHCPHMSYPEQTIAAIRNYLSGNNTN